MTPLLGGKRAVVTGGANGIGRAIVTELSRAGVTEGAILDLPTAASVSSVVDGWNEIPVDLRDDRSIREAFDQLRATHEAIDVLIAAAGIVPAWTGISDMDPDEWDDVFRVNARGVMRTIQEARPRMSEGSAIVVIASQNAWRGNENLASYTASKHAALGLVRSLALELGAHGIRVNAIGPGSVATEAYMSRLRGREASGGATVEQALANEARQTTLQRLTTVEDVARATVFLASDLASGVTGHLLPVGPATR
jgi:NAD(P)-dependent dehydrogenase (short-subunit alcohol dehydrogenase family)